MADLTLFQEKISSGLNLTPAEAAQAATVMVSADVADERKEAFLLALAEKGETPDEVAGFAGAFRRLARDPGVERWADRAIDIVGTGGGRPETFNLSTAVCFVLAAAGIPVMKHGNRRVTSQCGAADLLAGLGIDIEAPPEKLRGSLEELNFAFFFAPAYHPAFRQVAAVRKSLAAKGRRTIFNLLGPLCNPGRPAHQLVGVFASKWVSPLAQALEALGSAAGLVAHGELPDGPGIDELSTACPNRVAGCGRLRGLDEFWDPAAFGLRRGTPEALAGGTLEDNLALLERLLEGKAPEALTDTVVFNAAAGLWITGRADSVRDGIDHSRDLLLGGAVRRRIDAIKAFYRE